MKKIISLLLATVMIFGVTLSVSAAPLSDGLDAIRAEFQKELIPKLTDMPLIIVIFLPQKKMMIQNILFDFPSRYG